MIGAAQFAEIREYLTSPEWKGGYTVRLRNDWRPIGPAMRDVFAVVDALREELGLPLDKKVLLYVGRLSPEKNIEMLLAAFEALHARHPHTYHLVIVGDGPLRRVLPATRHRTGALTWRATAGDGTTFGGAGGICTATW